MSARTNVVRLSEAANKGDQSYRWQDRDPVIEELLAHMDASGLTDTMIAAKAMCTWQTVHNIRVKTKRPQNYTVDRIIKACGVKRVFVPLGWQPPTDLWA